ncbi:MAG TPA: hypothetical protein VF702_07505 [Allosphingosinicella sp.]|jgi:hypothetical protein
MPALASLWLEEVISGTEVADDDVRSAVVLMNLTAPPEVQWALLEAAIERSVGDEELLAIAAGPFEHLFGFHGDDYISQFEARCRQDARFARVTTGAYRHLMNDAVWNRVQAIQAGVEKPL